MYVLSGPSALLPETSLEHSAFPSTNPTSMSKRELERLAVAVDPDAPRAKRRREATTEEKPDVQMLDATRETVSEEERVKVKEQGSRLWQTVKDAVDNECVTEPVPVPDLYLDLPPTLICRPPGDASSRQSSFVFLPNDNIPTTTLSSRNLFLLTRSRLSLAQANTRR